MSGEVKKRRGGGRKSSADRQDKGQTEGESSGSPSKQKASSSDTEWVALSLDIIYRLGKEAFII